MAREELVEGIRMATEKGESLKDAMMSFLNAGYLKEDIEDAARIVQSGISIKEEKPLQKPAEESVEKITISENIPSAPATVQKISDYSGKEDSKMNPQKKRLLIALLVFLGVIGIFLFLLLLFKEKFISLFTGV